MFLPFLGKIRLVILGLTLVGAFVTYQALIGPAKVLDGPQIEALERALRQAAKDLPEIPKGAELAILPLRNDPKLYATERLQKAVKDGGRHRLLGKSILDSLRNLTEVKTEVPLGASDAVQMGGKLGASHVVFGNLATATHVAGKPYVAVELTVVDVGKAQVVGLPLVFTDPPAPPKPAPGTPGTPAPGTQATPATSTLGSRLAPYWPMLGAFGWRAGVWALATLALPALGYPVLTRILDRENNQATAAALVAWSLVSFIIAYGLAGFRIAGWVSAAMLFLGFCMALGYHYAAFSWISERMR